MESAIGGVPRVGGVANNVIRRQGTFGLDLPPIEPDRPSELHMPQHC